MGPYLIVAGDFVTTGGMDRANYALASYLARRADEVHLVAHRVAVDLLAYPNVVFHRVPKPAESYLLAGPLLDRVGRYWARHVEERGGRVIVNGGNCRWGDVNWVHYVHAAYQPQVSGQWLRRAKAGLSHRLFRRHERRTLGEARIVVANSQRTARDLTNLLGIPAKRVRVVYYGADGEVFRPLSCPQREAVCRELEWDTNRQKVAFIGALGDRRKGFDVVFDAWRQLCQARGSEAGWTADLVVIGQGSELPAWRRRAEEAGLTGRIEFLGFRTDVPRILSACDALVAPTRYEAYGLGVQEALCCGIPALVSLHAGVAERYSPELAPLLLPNPSDPADLQRRLLDWRKNQQTYRDAAATLSSNLREQTWERMAGEFVEAIADESCLMVD